MLTPVETLRQVILRLYPDNTTRMRLFSRRKITRGTSYTVREFRGKRRGSMSIINRSISRLFPLKGDGTLDLADAHYESRTGQAGIDIIMHVVYDEYCNSLNMPPLVRRTKTPFFGSDENELNVGDWEIA